MHIFLAEVLLELSSLMVIGYGQNCRTGWFGPRCQFQCHCSGSEGCDEIDGSCSIGINCENGFFGPGCQYVDHAFSARAEAQASWINDENDFTCDTDGTQEVTLVLAHSVPISWLRLVSNKRASGPMFYQDVTIVFNEKSVICRQKAAHAYDGNTADIYCIEMVDATVVTLAGSGVAFLCSLYISGGRNVAVRQEVAMSSQLTGTTADRPVDGSKKTLIEPNTCARSDINDHTPWWSVMFAIPQTIHTVNILNDATAVCPEDWTFVQENEHCYRHFSEIFTTNEDAEARCQVNGGHLATAKTRKIIEAVMALIIGEGTPWIGLYREEKLYPTLAYGDWYWWDNSSLRKEEAIWDGGRPSHRRYLDCVYIFEKSVWKNTECYTNKHTYICEIDLGKKHSRFTLEGFNQVGTKVQEFKANGTSILSHTIRLSGTTPVSSMRLTAERIDLCKVEAYGDTWCNGTRWGRECENNCYCSALPCYPSTGGCPNGCAEGYSGESCQAAHRAFSSLANEHLIFQSTHLLLLLIPAVLAVILLMNNCLKLVYPGAANTDSNFSETVPSLTEKSSVDHVSRVSRASSGYEIRDRVPVRQSSVINVDNEEWTHESAHNLGDTSDTKADETSSVQPDET